MGEDVVFDFNEAGGVARNLFGDGGNGENFLTFPLQFATGLDDPIDALEAFERLGGAIVYGFDFGVGVGGAYEDAEDEVFAIEIRGVFGAAGSLVGSIEAADALADDLAGFHWRPAVIRHGRPPS